MEYIVHIVHKIVLCFDCKLYMIPNKQVILDQAASHVLITISGPNDLLLEKLTAAQHVKKFVEGSQPCSEKPVLLKTNRFHFFKPYVFKIHLVLL